MQFQVELPHSFREFRPELFGIPFALESNHDIVSESHDDNIAVRPLLTPHLDPQVEHVMKIDVRQKRDRKSTRLNSSHGYISYAVFCLKKKRKPSIALLISQSIQQSYLL